MASEQGRHVHQRLFAETSVGFTVTTFIALMAGIVGSEYLRGSIDPIAGFIPLIMALVYIVASKFYLERVKNDQ